MIYYAALLFYGILTLWVQERWAWSLFQAGMFALAAWRGYRLSLAAIPLAAATLWSLLQLTFGTTVSRGSTFDAALDWFTFLVVFAIGSEVLADARVRQQFLRMAALFGGALAIVSVAQQYTSHGKVFWLFASGFSTDVLGPFVNRNQFAAWVELLLPVALYFRLWPVAGVLFLSVAASASRAGFTLAAVELIVGVAITTRRRIVLVPIAAAVMTAGWYGLHTRFGAPETLRMEAVRATLQMIADRPWTGYGLGTWSTVYPRYASFDPGVFLNQAHNDWLQWAAEGGVPMVLCMAVFTALLWRRAIPSIYGLGTVALLLHALVDYPMQQRPALAAWFFAIAAAAWCHRTAARLPERVPDLLGDFRPASRNRAAEQHRPRMIVE